MSFLSEVKLPGGKSARVTPAGQPVAGSGSFLSQVQVPTTPYVAPAAPAATPFANTDIGIALNTILGLPRAASNVGQSIIHSGVQAVTGAESSVAQLIPAFKVGPLSYNPQGAVPVTGGAFGKELFGENIQESAQTQAAHLAAGEDFPAKGFISSLLQDRIKGLETSPFAQRTGLNKLAPALAVGGVLGDMAIGATNPVDEGAAEEIGSLVKNFVKEKNPANIATALKDRGIPSDLADTAASRIAGMTSTSKVEKTMQALQDANQARSGLEAGEQATAESTWNEKYSEPYAQVSQDLSKAREVGDAQETKNLIVKQKEIEQNFIDEVKSTGDTTGSASEDLRRTNPVMRRANSFVPPELVPLEKEAQVAKTPEAFVESVNEKAGQDKALASAVSSLKPDVAATAAPAEIKNAQDTALAEFYNDSKQSVERSGPTSEAQMGSHLIGMPGEQFARSGEEEVNAVLAAKSPEEIAQVLKESGYAPAIAEKMAPEMQGLGRKEVEDALNVTHSVDSAKRIADFEERAAKFKLTPAKSVADLIKAPDGPEWSSILKGYSRNIPKVAKVHFFDYLGTPEFVLEKLGLQRGAELLQEAKETAADLKTEALNKVQSWKSEVEAATKGDPLSKVRIFRYLDGEARIVKSEMSPTELKVAGEIKEYLQGWASRLGLPEDHQISNYITHIFDKESIPTSVESVFDDPELAEIMNTTPAKSVYDPFLQARMGKKGYKQDVWAALDAYVKRGTRKEAMDPALEAITDMAKKLDGKSYQYVVNLTHRINMRPTELDDLLDSFLTQHVVGNKFTSRPTAYLTSKLRNIFYRGTLWANLSSPLRNLSQGANTYAKLGERYTIVGYAKLFGKMASNNLQELYDSHILDDSYIQDKKLGVYKTLLQKADPVMYSMFTASEKINRGAAYFGAKSKALAQGLSEEQAIKYAKRIVRETQFSFSSVDTPVALNSDIAKTVAQLQTYNVKQTEFFARMLKDKDFAGLTRWTLASFAFLFSIGKLFGMSPSQLLPSIGLGGSPTVGLVSDLGTLINPGANAQSKSTAKNDLGTKTWQLIPGGGQLRKTLQGIAAYNRGKDVTATGKTRYVIPHTLGSFLQASMFGKSSLPEAQAYYNKKN